MSLIHITTENLRNLKLVHFAKVLQHMIWLRNKIQMKIAFNYRKSVLNGHLKKTKKGFQDQ